MGGEINYLVGRDRELPTNSTQLMPETWHPKTLQGSFKAASQGFLDFQIDSEFLIDTHWQMIAGFYMAREAGIIIFTK